MGGLLAEENVQALPLQPWRFWTPGPLTLKETRNFVQSEKVPHQAACAILAIPDKQLSDPEWGKDDQVFCQVLGNSLLDEEHASSDSQSPGRSGHASPCRK